MREPKFKTLFVENMCSNVLPSEHVYVSLSMCMNDLAELYEDVSKRYIFIIVVVSTFSFVVIT